MPDFQRYPEKLFLIKYKSDSNVFVSLNCLFLFAVSLQKWLVHFLFLRCNGLTQRRINTFRVRKTTVFSTIKVSGVPRGPNMALPSLWNCHLCMEGHLKLRLQSLYHIHAVLKWWFLYLTAWKITKLLTPLTQTLEFLIVFSLLRNRIFCYL